ncbi:MAG: FAD-binding protein [Oscillospiraceae bacterium]|nr:FAD-binding protein [Oscillospiraceae bacterium]
MSEQRTVHQLTASVLIVGGGAAGMWAAKRIKEESASIDVLIVDKSAADWGGLMSLAGGDFDAVTPGEDLDRWVEDLVYYYDGLCDQELMETLFRGSYDRLKEYERLGCQYAYDENGRLKGIPQRGLDHFKLCCAVKKGRGGEDMRKALAGEMQRTGVRRLGRVMITRLLKEKGRVCGAVGFHCRTGEFYCIRAKAVLLASGCNGWKASYGNNTATGDGTRLAYDAGVKLTNFEFARVWNVPKLFAWEGQTVLLPLGARFVNAKGEDFMRQYSPVLGGNTDPHYTTIAMALEMEKGNGPVYFDTSGIAPENLPYVTPNSGWQVLNHEKLKALGIDFFSGRTEWVPQIMATFGGMVADPYGRTNVDGLFAAGRSRFLDSGNYIGGFDLSTTATTGYLAGKSIADDLVGRELPPALSAAELAQEQNALYAPLDRPGIQPKEVLRRFQELVDPYNVCLIKTEESLQRAMAYCQQVKEELVPRMGASDPHYLCKLYEVEAISLVTELYLRASLERRETRAGHYRTDYPGRDASLLGWIHLQKGANGIESSFAPVPLGQYRHPVTRYYTDQFSF